MQLRQKGGRHRLRRRSAEKTHKESTTVSNNAAPKVEEMVSYMQGTIFPLWRLILDAEQVEINKWVTIVFTSQVFFPEKGEGAWGLWEGENIAVFY